MRLLAHWILRALLAALVSAGGVAGAATPGGGEESAGHASIEGVLRDKLSGEPLPGSPIQLDGQDIVISDERGRFVFERVSPGAHVLWVQDPDHVPLRVHITLVKGQRLSVSYALDPVGSEEQEEVVVVSKRLQAEVSNTVVQMEEVKKIPGTQGDVGKIVQSLPGVAQGFAFSSGTMGPGLLIQGAAPQDSKILIDGHPVPLLYHFMGLTSAVNSDMLKSIDFIPGAFGAEFGEAIGGIVDTRTRPCDRKDFGGYINLGMIDAGVLLEGPLGPRAGFALAFRRSTVDVWLPSVLEDLEGFELTVAPVYYDYQLKFELLPARGDHLTLFAYGSSDEARLVMEQAVTADPGMLGTYQDQIQFHRVNLAWVHSPDPSWEFRTSLAGGYDQYHFRFGAERFVQARVYSMASRFDWEWQIDRRWFLHGGLLASTLSYEYSMRMPRPPKEGEVVADFASLEILEGTERTAWMWGGAYGVVGWSPVRTLLLTLGARVEAFDLPLNQVVLLPRLSLRYEPRPGTVLSAGFGMYAQAPAPDEMSRLLGNPDLDMVRARHYALRVQQDLPWQGQLDVEVFYKEMEELVVPDEKTFYSNAGRGKASGLQLMLRRDAREGPFGWLAYTLMRSERQDGPGQPWRLFDWDQTHILTVVLGYLLPTGPVVPAHGLRDGWQFGLRFSLVSGNPTTPLLGGIFDADYDSYRPIPLEKNSERLPLNHRLDVRVDYTWAFARWALTLFLDVQNAYNYRSVEGIRYNYDFTERAYFRGLPIIPALGLKGSF